MDGSLQPLTTVAQFGALPLDAVATPKTSAETSADIVTEKEVEAGTEPFAEICTKAGAETGTETGAEMSEEAVWGDRYSEVVEGWRRLRRWIRTDGQRQEQRLMRQLVWGRHKHGYTGTERGTEGHTVIAVFALCISFTQARREQGLARRNCAWHVAAFALRGWSVAGTWRVLGLDLCPLETALKGLELCFRARLARRPGMLVARICTRPRIKEQ